MDLIKKIGADAAEGVDLTVRHFGGGPLAFKDMLERNADFAVAGAPALADLKVKGEPVVSIATVNQVPTFTLMVRSDLKGRIRKVADLQDHVIGINSASAQARSTSRQVAEFVLRRAGVDLRRVHFMPAGQSLETQAAAIDSGAVDALMGDEPFASQLAAMGKVFHLVDLHDLDASRRYLGGLFTNAQLATRADVIKNEPEKVRRMVMVLRRTLKWIERHGPEEIVARLGIEDARQRANLLKVLQRHKAIYSPDGAFTREQLATAEAFYRANAEPASAAARFAFAAMVDPRWAGMKER